MNFSTAEENYIKAIWRLQQADNNVTTNELSAELQTKPASVTDMLKRLSEKKLLHYAPYYGVTLTPEGKKLALSIIRKHRLWEFFLVEKLQFEWDAVHDIAEELEHVSSPELIERLDAFLGYPKADPHGDPIPDSKGRMTSTSNVTLQQLPEAQQAIVTGVGDQSSSLLELLRQKNIGIGTKLEIKQRHAFDGSVEIKIRNQALINLSEQLAKNIFVKPI
ncbi:metal-dependent transcriptional regulator [Lacibacter sp. H407]|uniref:metal-dependent transcriptional regulator n=1 Tax=Lacibacter sp. H407 TaxID=3133423 RepID=UPI0030C19D8A